MVVGSLASRGQQADSRDTANAAQAAAASSERLPSSPSSTSSSSTTTSPGTPAPAHADDATDKAAPAAGLQVLLDAPERPGDATPNPAQGDATARAASDALPPIPPDATLPPDDVFEASDASAETGRSSNCDPQLPEEAPVIAAPNLAAVLAAQCHRRSPS